MKYFIAVFVTAVTVFLGATIYYKGFPEFGTPKGVSVSSDGVALSPSPVPSATPNEESALLAAVKAGLIVKHGQNAAALNVTVTKIESEYAQGGASGDGGGGMWFAAKLNGNWTLVWDGNGQINCSDISPYPLFPKDMIAECWDASSGKLITR